MSKKPNILMIMTDEHPVFMNGCYGHRSAITPNIDKLAEQGLVFDAAYCPSPICAPSRAAMLAGRHVSTIGVWDNASPFHCDWPTFVHSLRNDGYRTILAGKMHFVGPDQMHGFEERWTQDIYPATFDWTYVNREHVAYNNGQNHRRVFQAGPGRTDDMDYDDEVLFRALYGLRMIERKDDERPFFLCVSFTGPHYPFIVPQKYWDMYSDDDIDLPQIPENFLEKEIEYVKWLRYHGNHNQLVPDDICRKARRAILGRITLIDEYIGKVIDQFDNLEDSEKSLVLFTADHGDMMGEHGLWFKNAAYEWSSRVPLIIKGPDVKHGRSSEVVSLLDIGPTLCGLTGIQPVHSISDGRDLSDLVTGKRKDRDGLAIMENYGEGVYRGWRMARKGNYKMTLAPGFGQELFDLKKDPGEWNNLINDPSYKEIRDDLEKTILKDWDFAKLDEERLKSEDRRAAIKISIGMDEPAEWQIPSPPVPVAGQKRSVRVKKPWKIRGVRKDN